MTSSNADRNGQVRLQRAKRFNLLANAVRKQNALKAGLVSALVLMGAANFAPESFAQQTSQIQTVNSPWTGQNGREAVDLSAKPITKAVEKNTAKKTAPKRASRIRQVQAAIPQEDLLGGDLNEPLRNPEFDNVPLEKPTVGVEEVIGGLTPVPEALETVPATPATTTAPETPPVSSIPKRLQTSESVPPQNYPQKELVKDNNANPNTRSNAVPGYSTNPYSRIGQAEYNPAQFYGGASPNSSINGYRNAPPVVAYGQNLYGVPSEQGYCDGAFGGFFQNTQLSAGFDGMKSAIDLADPGNYGGDFAVNWGSARPVFGGLHLQAGARGVFTDLNGTVANGFETNNSRSQTFWTAGAYFRSNQFSTEGLSFGVVYDSLTDKYYRKYELRQLRTELSYTFGGGTTLGFRGAFGLNEDWCELLNLGGGLTIDAKAKSTDYYTAFLRRAFDQGGEFTIFGGVTEQSGGIAGGSIEAPISDSFSLKCSGSYVFPKNRGFNKREEETWGMSMGLVWHLGGGARNTAATPRPLFDVADNGSLLQNFVR